MSCLKWSNMCKVLSGNVTVKVGGRTVLLSYPPLSSKTTWNFGIHTLTQWSMLESSASFFSFRLWEKTGREAWQQPITCAFVHWFDPFADSRSPPGKFMGQGKWMVSLKSLPVQHTSAIHCNTCSSMIISNHGCLHRCKGHVVPAGKQDVL